LLQLPCSGFAQLMRSDTADRQEPSEAIKTKTNRQKIEKLKEQMRRLERPKVEMLAAPNQQISLTDPDARSMATGRGSGIVGYNVAAQAQPQRMPAAIKAISSNSRQNAPCPSVRVLLNGR
jgi:hypothetical protein